MSFASHTESTKPVRQEPPDRHKRCATCARAARSPDASRLIVACAVAAGIQRRKRTPNQQRSTKSRPHHNRCHLLRTQKVQIRCGRSRPIVQKGAQRAHGPSAAPMMHHAWSQHAQPQLASSAESAIRISKGAPKAGRIIIGVISFAHKKCKKQVPQEPPDRQERCSTSARAGRSPDASCLIVACTVAAGIQRRKRNPNQQRSTKSRPPNNRCRLLRTQKVQKAGAIGAARSSQKVRNVRTGRPQPRCIMPDRSMHSRSCHPAQKAQPESAKEHQKQAPHNRCHFLRTQKVQSRCDRSRPIVTKGAQRAHGPSAAPMHHA